MADGERIELPSAYAVAGVQNRSLAARPTVHELRRALILSLACGPAGRTRTGILPLRRRAPIPLGPRRESGPARENRTLAFTLGR